MLFAFLGRIRRGRQWMFLTMQQNVNNGTEIAIRPWILPKPIIGWFNITGTAITRSIPLRLRLFHALGLNCCNTLYLCRRTVQSIVRIGAILKPGLTAAYILGQWRVELFFLRWYHDQGQQTETFKFESQPTWEQPRRERKIIKMCLSLSVTQVAQDWLLLFLMRELFN